MLREGKLVDAYRKLNPEGGENDFTWRGRAGEGGKGRYGGRGENPDKVHVTDEGTD